MLNIDVKKKYEIASLGFYADPENCAFVCFSCVQIIKFKDSENIHEKHKILSPFCAFLQGRDVSVNISTNYDQVTILGTPQFSNIEFFTDQYLKLFLINSFKILLSIN